MNNAATTTPVPDDAVVWDDSPSCATCDRDVAACTCSGGPDACLAGVAYSGSRGTLIRKRIEQ
jgi:hypothetical protein